MMIKVWNIYRINHKGEWQEHGGFPYDYTDRAQAHDIIKELAQEDAEYYNEFNAQAYCEQNDENTIVWNSEYNKFIARATYKEEKDCHFDLLYTNTFYYMEYVNEHGEQVKVCYDDRMTAEKEFRRLGMEYYGKCHKAKLYYIDYFNIPFVHNYVLIDEWHD